MIEENAISLLCSYLPQPANDPYGISQEDLVLGLRRALASTPLFAPYFLPLLQEKLDSDITSAKLDALHTLVRMNLNNWLYTEFYLDLNYFIIIINIFIVITHYYNYNNDDGYYYTLNYF